MRMFDRLDKIVNRQVDRIYAVDFVVKPMRSSANGRPSTDPERGEIVGQGVFDAEHEDVTVQSQRTDRGSKSFNTTTSGNDFELSVDSRRYPNVHEARQGDEVVLDDARRFRVVGRKDDGFGRLVLKLHRA